VVQKRFATQSTPNSEPTKPVLSPTSLEDASLGMAVVFPEGRCRIVCASFKKIRGSQLRRRRQCLLPQQFGHHSRDSSRERLGCRGRDDHCIQKASHPRGVHGVHAVHAVGPYLFPDYFCSGRVGCG
jgi:hypothetical protein